MQIELIQKEIEALQAEGGSRDQNKWKQLKRHLNDAHREKEEYWSRKARLHWLKKGDKKNQIFSCCDCRKKEKE